MADYIKTTDFAAKDALTSGDPNKVVKGTEIDDEFQDIETAVATKVDNTGDTVTGTLNFTDSVKATFGTGGDLEITHNTTDNVINSVGTADLLLQKGGVTVAEVDSSGVDVTGTVTADGLTVDGDVAFTDGAATPKFFWDASAESLGIGTSSPDSKLHLSDTGESRITFEGAAWGSYIGVTSYDNVVISADENQGSGSSSIRFRVDGSERMRIDSSGNVGIGTDSPDATLDVVGPNDNTPQFRVGNTAGGTDFSIKVVENGATYLDSGEDTTARPLLFTLGGTEAMRIDSSGNLLVGKAAYLNATAGHVFSTEAADGAVHRITRANNTNTQSNVRFYTNGGSIVGSITTTTSATSYNTSSDYRLKEDWQPMLSSWDRVKDLKPVNFAWKVDGSRVDGFLAHELAEVVPEAVTGEKDAVDDEGNPVYQGIDQSKLVPLLTAALQEALARIETLEADVAALKGE